MKKENVFFLTIFFISIALSILVINIGLNISRNSIVNSTVDQLEVTSLDDKRIVESKFQSNMTEIQSLSEKLSGINGLDNHVDYIKEKISTSNFSRLCYVPVGEESDDYSSENYNNGKSLVITKFSYQGETEPFSVTSREYYKRGINGESSIVLINNSNFDGSTVLIFTAPIYDESNQSNENIVALIYGVITKDNLNELTRTTEVSNEKESLSFILTSDGTLLTDFDDNLESRKTGNLFSYLENTRVNNNLTTFDVNAFSIVGESGYLQYFDTEKNVTVYAKYQKVTLEDENKKSYFVKNYYVLTATNSQQIDISFKSTKQSMIFVGMMVGFLGLTLVVIQLFYINVIKKETIETKNKIEVKNKELFLAISKADSTIFEYELYNNVLKFINNALGNDEIPSSIPRPTKNKILLKYISKVKLSTYLEQCFKLTKDNDTYQEIFKIENGINGLTYYLVSSTAIFDTKELILKFIGSIKNVTKTELIRQKNEYEKNIRNTILREAEFSMTVNISKDTFSSPNPAMRLLLESVNANGFEDAKCKLITKEVYREDKEKMDSFLSKENLLGLFISNKLSPNLEFSSFETGSRRYKKISVILTQEKDTKDIIALVAIYDINESKNRELILQDKARHDHLTGLLNRYSCESEFKRILNEYPSSIFLIIDIDNFKTQNDSYGHQFGDKVLVEFSRRLNRLITPIGKVSRLGGDEFVALITKEFNKDDLENFVKQLSKKLTLVYNKGIKKETITCSIGVEISNEKINKYDELYKRADKKLYIAKSKGKNTYVL